MIKFSSSIYLQVSIKLLILLLISKFIAIIFWWFLPNDGVDFVYQDNYQPKYQKVDFRNMVNNSKKAVKNRPIKDSDLFSGLSITSMVLRGLYGTSTRGYVIVSLKLSPKQTSIVGVGESFSGYILKSIRPTSAIFTKADIEYILELENTKKSQSYIKPIENGSSMSVSMNDISFYAKNPSQIWEDISIVEVKNGKKIDGFKVTRINNKSKMANLGLEKGDIIIEANNIRLRSYKDALDIYSNINKLKMIQIVVMRNNEERELTYEIN